MPAILDGPSHATASFPHRVASNDNVETRRVRQRECFAVEEYVATRRKLKLRDNALIEGSVGRILKIRAPGRLYDVSFAAAEAIVMTLSHCDIARCRPSLP